MKSNRTNRPRNLGFRRAACRTALLLLAAFAVAPARAAEPAELSPAERMQFADGLYRRGLFEPAAGEYRALLSSGLDFEGRDAALFRLAECLRRQDRPAEAREGFRRLLAEYPSGEHRFRAALRLAEMDLDGGDLAAARSQLEALLEAGPEPPIAAAAAYELGYLLSEQGFPREAEQRLREMLEAHPESPLAPFALLQLGDLLAADGRIPEAVTFYEQATEQAAGTPTAREAHFRKAFLLFETGAYDRAAEAFDLLRSRYADDPRLDRLRLQAAWAFYYSGRFLEALDLDDGGGAEAEDEWLYLRANAQRQLLRTDAADAGYQRLLEEYPSSPFAEPARFERCLLAFRSGDYEGLVQQAAGTAFDPAVLEDVHWMLAESYAALGQTDHAIQHYRSLVDHFAQGQRAPRALYRLATLLRERGDFTLSSRMLRRLAETYPDDDLAPQALLDAGHAQVREGRYAEAVRDWALLLEKYPEAPQAEEGWFRRGLAEARLERDAQALQALETLLQRHPGSEFAVEALDWVGMLRARNGALEEAETAFREALTRQPGPSWTRRIRFHLATVLQQRGREAEAAGLLQELVATPSLEEFPPGLLEWLARHQLAEGQFAEAAAAGEALARQAGEDDWRQIGWYLAGAGLERQGKPAEARAAFERALGTGARTREGAEAALRLGRLALEAGEPEIAAGAFREAAERAVSEPLLSVRAQALQGLGRAAAALDQWEEAARYFMSVALLFDDPVLTPESLTLAAEAYHRLGRNEEKTQALEELRLRFPDHPAGGATD